MREKCPNAREGGGGAATTVGWLTGQAVDVRCACRYRPRFVQNGRTADGRVTEGRKGIAYLRDHYGPEMSVVATERLQAVSPITTEPDDTATAP